MLLGLGARRLPVAALRMVFPPRQLVSVAARAAPRGTAAAVAAAATGCTLRLALQQPVLPAGSAQLSASLSRARQAVSRRMGSVTRTLKALEGADLNWACKIQQDKGRMRKVDTCAALDGLEPWSRESEAAVQAGPVHASCSRWCGLLSSSLCRKAAMRLARVLSDLMHCWPAPPLANHNQCR